MASVFGPVFLDMTEATLVRCFCMLMCVLKLLSSCAP